MDILFSAELFILTMDTLIYLKKIPLMKGIFGVCLLIFSLTAVAFGYILIGLISLSFSLNLLASQGTQINFVTKTFRTIKSVAGIPFGTWKPCPDFEYVSVFQTKESQTINVVTASTTFKNDVILINLFYNGNRHLTFYKTDDKAEAFKIAYQFKNIFNIDILDATQSEKVWL